MTQTRRQIIKNIGKTLILPSLAQTLFINGCNDGLEKKLTANEMLRDFPDEIMGAKEVVKYEVPDAEYCLAHLRQTHDGNVGEFVNKSNIPEQDKEITTKLIYMQVNQVQKEIYNILKEVNKKQGISDIYLEGLLPNHVDLVRNSPKEVYQIYLNEFIERGVFDPKTEEANYFFIPGGALALNCQGKINLCAAESEDTYKFAKIAKNLPEGEIKDKFLKTMREDALIDIVAKDGNPFALTVYGSDHNFKDNIEKYNSENQNKFSLIEITPASYVENIGDLLE